MPAILTDQPHQRIHVRAEMWLDVCTENGSVAECYKRITLLHFGEYISAHNWRRLFTRERKKKQIIFKSC